MAFGIINFAVINGLADGGFSGITIILYHLFGFSPGISSFFMNLPMLLISYRLFDKPTFFMTIFGIFSLSSFLRLFEVLGPLLPNLQSHMFLVVIGYGVSVGFGLGMILHGNGTTGGSAIVAKIGKDLWDIPMDKTFFIFDLLVVLASFFLFLSLENGIYTIIGLFICSRVIARFQNGFHSGYKVLISSNHHQEIINEVHKQLGQELHLLEKVDTSQTKKEKILLTIIDKKQLTAFKKIVNCIDSQGIISISHTYETSRKNSIINKKTLSS